MSCYNWEKGDFIIPAAEWAGLKKSIRDADAAFDAKAYEFAVALYADLKTRPAADRKKDPRHRAYDSAEKNLRVGGHGDEAGNQRAAIVERVLDAISRSTYDPDTRISTYSVSRPRKTEFAPKGNNVNEFRASYGEASIVFDNETRTVHWEVSENNRAVEKARDSHIGIALFRALARVQWTRDTGGMVVGNDEYNQDAGRDNGCGGGVYDKDGFGPLGGKKTGVEAAPVRGSAYSLGRW